VVDGAEDVVVDGAEDVVVDGAEDVVVDGAEDVAFFFPPLALIFFDLVFVVKS
jgi:hypothetical protein